MEEAPADPLDIAKEPELVKEAQSELAKTDVLVCGGCHEVFHFVEEFQEHKTQCTNQPALKCDAGEKPQVWGFNLWKVKQLKEHKEKQEELPNSWEIYQKWTKLTQDEKNLWISAGDSLKFVQKFATAKLKEVNNKDPLALDDDIESQGRRIGIRGKDEKEEYIVEKITGKRFNPRKRYWEYRVKWENYEDLSWEPLPNLDNCKNLVEEFEAKLKAEKEQREKDKPPSRGRGRPRLTPGSTPTQKKPALTPSPIIVSSPDGGRPQRSSKQKALNQVKAWCGSISDEEGGSGKRPLDDDDSDDSFEKKIRLEGESESEEEAPRTPARKVAKIIHTYNNGTGKKLPDNILIPDAKGVVRISQKQLPSLSSGVYIMSKSSGIIKLDPTASKIATSGGQAIVKVSPKIGQTQIRIIKKEERKQVTTPQVATPAVAPPKPKPKILQQSRTPAKKEPKKTLPPAAQSDKPEEDSDDGIPELEFPTDLPLPQPESPPSDFTLDPITGKVAGVEYPVPEPEPVVNEHKPQTDQIDNIVKLAAADITEEDLKPTNGEAAASPPTTTAPPPPAVATPPVVAAAKPATTILQKTLQKPKTQPRIINQSLAKPQKAPLKTPPKPRFNISPKNVYSANNVARRIGNTTVYKTPKKASPQQPKQVISMPSLEEEPVAAPTTAAPMETNVSLALAAGAGDRQMFITGDDGTVYQVAGQNEDGQTILVTQDSDGQQQCLLVTGEALQEEAAEEEAAVVVQEPMEVAEEQPLVAQFIRTEPPSPGGTHKVVVMLPDGDVMVTQVTPEEYASLELDK